MTETIFFHQDTWIRSIKYVYQSYARRVCNAYADELQVSHIDGKILWRLGGVKSDFVFKDQRAKFTRQHHARFRGQNSTHTLVSLFDNARGDIEAKASSFESWGLLIALRTDVTPMTVELVSRYQKPFGSGNPREKARGRRSTTRLD